MKRFIYGILFCLLIFSFSFGAWNTQDLVTSVSPGGDVAAYVHSDGVYILYVSSSGTTVNFTKRLLDGTEVESESWYDPDPDNLYIGAWGNTIWIGWLSGYTYEGNRKVKTYTTTDYGNSWLYRAGGGTYMPELPSQIQSDITDWDWEVCLPGIAYIRLEKEESDNGWTPWYTTFYGSEYTGGAWWHYWISMDLNYEPVFENCCHWADQVCMAAIRTVTTNRASVSFYVQTGDTLSVFNTLWEQWDSSYPYYWDQKVILDEDDVGKIKSGIMGTATDGEDVFFYENIDDGKYYSMTADHPAYNYTFSSPSVFMTPYNYDPGASYARAPCVFDLHDGTGSTQGIMVTNNKTVGSYEYNLFKWNEDGSSWSSVENAPNTSGTDLLYWANCGKETDDLYIFNYNFDDSKFVIHIKDQAPPVPTLVSYGYVDDHPKMGWTKPCLDAESYKICRKVDGTPTMYDIIGMVDDDGSTQYYYTDYDVSEHFHGDDINYKIFVHDYNGTPSSLSNMITFEEGQIDKRAIPEIKSGFPETEFKTASEAGIDIDKLMKYAKVIGSDNIDGTMHYSVVINPFDLEKADIKIDINEESIIPNIFGLNSHPNPFNPVTKISYDVPNESQVIITIFNILGQEVKKLVNKVHTAGRYNVEFNGTNLTSGVYIVNMAAFDKSGELIVKNQKITLLK